MKTGADFKFFCLHNLFDSLFFDWLTFIILAIIFLIGLIFLFPSKITLNIPDPNIQIYITDSLLRNISLFIGISFSFVLLSFNIFYRYFGRYAFIDFFKNRPARFCLTLLICTIGLLIYTTSYIRGIDEVDRFDKFLYIFSVLLSIISFFSVFPCLLILLRNSQNRENIKRLFGKLNEDWLIDGFQTKVIDKSPHRFYHKDPVSILNEIGLSSIKEFDNITVLVITTTCSDFYETNIKLYESGKSKIDNFTLYHEFRNLLSNLFQLSVKERNEYSSMIIVNCRFQLEKLVLNNINNKEFERFADYKNTYKHWLLNFDTIDYFKRAIQFNEDEICKTLIDQYRCFVTQAIPTLFPKDFVYTKGTHFQAAQNAEMVFDPLRNINELSSYITTYKKSQLFEPIFTLYSSVEDVASNLKISNEAKYFLLNVIFNYKYEIFSQYSDLKDVQHITYLNYPFRRSTYIFEKTGCSIPHSGSLQILSLLLYKNKLNTVVINEQKAGMLHLVELFKNGNIKAKDLLLSSIKKFEDLGTQILKTDSDYRKEIYLKLDKYLAIVFNDAVANNNITDVDILYSFTKAADSFSFKTLFENDLKAKGYVGDERIT